MSWCDHSFQMRRTLSIAAAILVLTQALAAGVPMLHQPPPPKAHVHAGHECCPKPVVEVRNCCPTTVACPQRNHSAGACCCAESGGTAVPSRKVIGNVVPAVVPLAIVYSLNDAQQGWALAWSSGPPLDNSPPILVLRN